MFETSAVMVFEAINETFSMTVQQSHSKASKGVHLQGIRIGDDYHIETSFEYSFSKSIRVQSVNFNVFDIRSNQQILNS